MHSLPAHCCQIRIPRVGQMSFVRSCEFSSSCRLYVEREVACSRYYGKQRWVEGNAQQLQPRFKHAVDQFQFPLQHRRWISSNRVVDYFTSATSAALLLSWSCPWVVACPLFAPSSHRLEVDLAFCSRRRDGYPIIIYACRPN